MAIPALRTHLSTPERPSLALLHELSGSISDLLEAQAEKFRTGRQSRPISWTLQRIEVGSLSIDMEGLPSGHTAASDFVDRFCLDLLQDIHAINEHPIEQLEQQFALDVRPLRAIRRLGTLAVNQKGTFLVEYGDGSVHIGGDTVEKVNTLLEARFVDWGSLEGSLETISIHRTPYFRLYASGGQGGVECRFQQELLPETRDALGKRVMVWGMLHRSNVGSIERIDVKQMEVLEAVALDEIRPTGPLWPGQSYDELHKWAWGEL